MSEWKIKGLTKEEKTKINELAISKEVSVSPIPLKYLVTRGFDTPQKINKLLNFNENDIPDIKKAKDADVFNDRLIEAVTNKETITILGDYDADGICATAIAKRALALLGVNANYFVSNRFSEGYGISKKSVSRLLKEYPDTSLILTVDNGILGFEGVDYANECGVDVIISDHHEPSPDGTLPNAVAIVDVKRLDDEYPFKELCGAGLIYRLMKELFVRGGLNNSTFHLDHLLAFVAVATVGDVVPLTDENRYYVLKGLAEINNPKLVCFEALSDVLKPKEINEETLGFSYVPLLNAIGRIKGDVIPAIELLLSNDREFCLETANYLKEINTERQRICQREQRLANKIVETHLSDNVLIVVGEGFGEGTVGIAAGRLKEEHAKPVIVLTPSEDDPNILKGSGRSVEGYSLKNALDINKDLLLYYGGHELAAGLSIKKENVETLREKLCELAKTEEFQYKADNTTYIDIVIEPKDVSYHLVSEINDELRPFGQGFPKPVIGLRSFTAEKSMAMPKDAPTEDDKKHVRLTNEDGFSVLWFNGYKKWKEMGEPLGIKALGTPSINIYRGNTSFQFLIQGGQIKKES